MGSVGWLRRLWALVAVSVLGVGAQAAGASVVGSIINVDAEFANVDTDIAGDAVGAAALGSTLRFRHGGFTYVATYVDDFAAVARGEWVVIVDEDRLTIAISFGDACDVLECELGDAIEVEMP